MIIKKRWLQLIVELKEKESVPITYDNTNDLSEEQMEEKVNLCDTSQVLQERESSSDKTSDKMEEDVKEVAPNNITVCQNDVENISPMKSPKKVHLNHQIVMDKSNRFDPSSLVGLQISRDEKEFLLELEPCLPSEDVLKHQAKKQGN